MCACVAEGDRGCEEGSEMTVEGEGEMWTERDSKRDREKASRQFLRKYWREAESNIKST